MILVHIKTTWIVGVSGFLSMRGVGERDRDVFWDDCLKWWCQLHKSEFKS